MSAKVKLLSCISIFMLMLGVLILGVLAVGQQTITLDGNINFNVADKSLWVKSISISKDNITEEPITDFMPGYINGDFELTIPDQINSYGTLALYIEIINTSESSYTVDASSKQENVSVSVTVENENNILPAGTISPEQITQDTEATATIKLIISSYEDGIINLDNITIVFTEVKNLNVYSSNTTYGSVSYSGINSIGNTITLTASVEPNGVFYGWRAESLDGEYMSGDLEYSYVVEQNSPTTIYGVFEGYTTSGDFSFKFNDPATGEASIDQYKGTSSEVVIPSVVNNNGTQYIVTTLVDDAFAANINIETVILPSSLKTLGSSFRYDGPFVGVDDCETGLFEDCSNLRYVNFEDLNNLTTIGDATFMNCTSLESVYLPNTLENIGGEVFNGCKSLTSVIFEKGCKLKTLTGTFANCTSLKEIEIPASVEEIVFRTIRHTDTSFIGTFKGCTNLVNVTFEEGSRLRVLNGAFSGCSSLETLTIPATVETISSYTTSGTFQNCTNLKTLYFLSIVPPTATSGIKAEFYNLPESTIIYVPKGTLSAYQEAAGWSDIADQIQEMP